MKKFKTEREKVTLIDKGIPSTFYTECRIEDNKVTVFSIITKENKWLW